MLFAGIDAGSRTIKVVLIDDDMRIVASGLADQGVRQARLAYELFNKVLLEAGADRSAVEKISATGYGRNALDWVDLTVTEITCQAHGIKYRYPYARTIVDIGGQDSKLIRLDSRGAVRDFTMNDRCAAGTGRFLEIVANRLEVDLEELGVMAGKAVQASVISSMCAVFAETEIVGLLAAEESPENIAAGVQHSIAKRVVSMAGSKTDEPVIFTGGVALVPGMDQALAAAFGCNIVVAEKPQLTAALGAALMAADAGKINDDNGLPMMKAQS